MMATFAGKPLFIKWFRETAFCTSQPAKVLQYENKQTESFCFPPPPLVSLPFPSFLPLPLLFLLFLLCLLLPSYFAETKNTNSGRQL